MATVAGSNNVGLKNIYGPIMTYPVAANVNINQGAAVCVDASGNANPGADTSGLVFVGTAQLAAINSTGTAGAVSVQVEVPVFAKARQYNAVSPDKTWIGKRAFLSDDNTVVLAASSSNKVIVGTVISVDVPGTSGVVTVDLINKAVLATT